MFSAWYIFVNTAYEWNVNGERCVGYKVISHKFSKLNKRKNLKFPSCPYFTM